MIMNKLTRPVLNIQRLIFTRNSSILNIEKLERENDEEPNVYSDEAATKEAEIERKRNKSRLRDADRNTLLGKKRYDEPVMWFHNTLKYNRRAYGLLGSESGIDPSICWPTEQELTDQLEYERIAHPFTVLEMIESNKQKQKEKEEKTLNRQRDLVAKMEKLDSWIKDMEDRIAKKENEAKAAKARRERLIEEVRAHFGYTVDPREDKFKEMVEKKEKEQKKALKEARKKANEQKLMEKLIKKNSEKKL